MKRREFNIVVSTNSNNLYGFAVRFLHNKEDAKDIVQDVFEKLWINRNQVEFVKAKAWLFKVAYNSMINYSSKKGRMITTDQHAVFEKKGTEQHSFESQQVVERAVNILPPVQRTVVLLRDIEGYSYKEIGEIVGLSDSQVKVYLFRARMKIKKQLKGLRELV